MLFSEVTRHASPVCFLPFVAYAHCDFCVTAVFLSPQGSGRRSSRLTARTAKAAEDMRLAEQAAAEAAEAAAAANAFAGPPGGCLLDACSAAELALIANQVPIALIGSTD